jgi:uncharacterized membrane protein
MNGKKIIFPFLLLLLPASMMPASADSSYQTIYSGWLDSGQILQVNGCYVKLIAGGAGYVTGIIKSPNYADWSNTIYSGHPVYYYDALKIYVVEVDMDNKKALVDISKPSSDSQSSSEGTKLACDVPGQYALGGDTVSFPIAIKNCNDEDKTYTLSSSSESGWDTGFIYSNKEIYKIFVPKGQTKTIELMVETSASSQIGEKKVTVNVDDVSLDLYVYITSVNQTTEVSSTVSSKISSIGEKIQYELVIKNIQANENVYGLSVDGLMDNWYYRFKESSTSTSEMAEAVLPGNSEKKIILEIVPPYSVSEGDYNFTAKVKSSDGIAIEKALTLKLKSSVEMSTTSSKLAYDASPGQAFDIDLYVSNDGTGGTLTNVDLEIDVPDGWLISTYPEMVNSIKAGESSKFTINVQPPGNIVASDYEVNVNVKSDQAEEEKTYRITIKTVSYIPYIGGGLILLVLAGLILMYRKYGRR